MALHLGSNLIVKGTPLSGSDVKDHSHATEVLKDNDLYRRHGSMFAHNAALQAFHTGRNNQVFYLEAHHNPISSSLS